MDEHGLYCWGIGLKAPQCDHKEDLWKRINDQQPLFAPIESFDCQGCHVRFAGEVRDVYEDPIDRPKLRKLVNKKDYLSLVACARLLQSFDAGLWAKIPPLRRGAFVGTSSTQIEDLRPYFSHVLDCVSEDRRDFNSQKLGSECLNKINPIVALKVLLNGSLAHICASYQIEGPNTSLMNCENATADALHYASFALHDGSCDVAVVGGVSAGVEPFYLAEAQKTHELMDQRDIEHVGQIINLRIPYLEDKLAGRILSEGAIYGLFSRAQKAIWGKSSEVAPIGRVTFPGKQRWFAGRDYQESLTTLFKEYIRSFDPQSTVIMGAAQACSYDLVEKEIFKDYCLISWTRYWGDFQETHAMFQLAVALDVLKNPSLMNLADGLNKDLGVNMSKINHVVVVSVNRFAHATAFAVSCP